MKWKLPGRRGQGNGNEQEALINDEGADMEKGPAHGNSMFGNFRQRVKKAIPGMSREDPPPDEIPSEEEKGKRKKKRRKSSKLPEDSESQQDIDEGNESSKKTPRKKKKKKQGSIVEITPILEESSIATTDFEEGSIDEEPGIIETKKSSVKFKESIQNILGIMQLDRKRRPAIKASPPEFQTIWEKIYLRLVYPVQTFATDIVDAKWFQFFILALIILNSVLMSLATYRWVKERKGLDELLVNIDNSFLVIFTVELAFQFLSKGIYLFTDGWLVFDFITVISSWAFKSFQVIRAFRIFRALRLITKIQTLKNLVTALIEVLPDMGAIFSLLVLVLYIFAVVFTSLFKGTLEDEYFDSLGKSLFTLFQFLTLDWVEVTRELMVIKNWSKYVVVVFILISGFIVYNLFVAVLCDAITDLRKKDEEMEELKELTPEDDGMRLKKRIRDLNKEIEDLRKENNNIKAKMEDAFMAIGTLEDQLRKKREFGMGVQPMENR